MSNGSLEEIEHLLCNSAIKTLGLMTCPSGSNAAALDSMRQQNQEWVDKVIASTLNRQNLWFMVDCQFWPWLGYGICNNSATWNELEGCLQRVYWQLVRSGGVRQMAPVLLRQLDQGFYGIGCPHPGVECLVAQLTKLLLHYGCRLGLGIQMSVTMELLLTKLGMSLQPLQASYTDYGKWVTNTWLKSVWEKVYKFNITVEIALLPIKPPRKGDKWFMQAVIESGLTNAEELIQINRYCCHQQVLFVSDVLDASGEAINKRYLKRRKDHIKWSVLIFLIKNPPRRNLKLWQQVLYSLAPRGRVQQRVGHFLTRAIKSGNGNTTSPHNGCTTSRVM
jgi:hypothetical protein